MSHILGQQETSNPSVQFLMMTCLCTVFFAHIGPESRAVRSQIYKGLMLLIFIILSGTGLVINVEGCGLLYEEVCNGDSAHVYISLAALYPCVCLGFVLSMLPSRVCHYN